MTARATSSPQYDALFSLALQGLFLSIKYLRAGKEVAQKSREVKKA
jgi:hypothetical protein